MLSAEATRRFTSLGGLPTTEMLLVVREYCSDTRLSLFILFLNRTVKQGKYKKVYRKRHPETGEQKDNYSSYVLTKSSQALQWHGKVKKDVGHLSDDHPAI